MHPAEKQREGVILIMPRRSSAWKTAEALWITAAGWGAAARRKFGHCWIVTVDRIAQPEEVVRYPDGARSRSVSRTSITFPFLRILLSDLRLFWSRRNWSIVRQQPWKNHRVLFVWQQHDLFPGPGATLARKLKVPLIVYVHGPVVWEAERWGVKRGWWGRLLERFVESPSLKQADVVACVSASVADKVKEMGVDSSRIAISPMAADPDLFQPSRLNQKILFSIRKTDIITIGWIGSFRSFHGLDHVVDAFKAVKEKFPGTRLVLVGDGKEKPGIELKVSQEHLSGSVVFTGHQSFNDIPTYIASFDICVVSARSSADFHYSPLKLREYLVAGRAVVAPDAGEIPRVFKDYEQLLLYKTGDVQSLANKLLELVSDQSLRDRLSKSGSAFARLNCTWDAELDKVSV